MMKKEEPVLTSLKYTSICLHFVEVNKKCKFEYDPVISSMEQDLLAYQFQVNPLLNSKAYKCDKVTIIFPTSLTYHTEERSVPLLCEETKRRKPIDLKLCKTEFLESGIRIWHLTLSACGENSFNEYEIIKLISLYDGRSENTGPYKVENTSAEHKLADDIKFEYNSKTCSILELIEQLTADPENEQTDSAQPKLELKSGTIQILADEDVMEPLLTAVKARREDDKEAHQLIIQAMQNDRLKGKILRSLSGIAIGIFDFEETDGEEILDTFEPSFSDSSVFIKFNRCTLLSIAMSDRALKVSKDMVGVSPYLIIPHAVIIHNEKLIEMAMDNICQAEKMIDNRSLYGCHALCKLDQTEKLYEGANRYMHRWYLPMIFNYPTETTLFSQGNIKRGSIEKYKIVQSRLKELHSQIVSLWELRRGFGAAVIAALLALISAVQLMSLVETGIAKLVILVLAFFIFYVVLRLSLSGLGFKSTKK